MANGVCTLRFVMDGGLRVTGVSSGQACDGQQWCRVVVGWSAARVAPQVADKYYSDQ